MFLTNNKKTNNAEDNRNCTYYEMQIELDYYFSKEPLHTRVIAVAGEKKTS